MSSSTTRCPICGAAHDPGTTLFSVDLGGGVVVVRDVPAMVCSQCGEAIIDDDVAARLEAIVNRARDEHAEIAVIHWPDAAA